MKGALEWFLVSLFLIREKVRISINTVGIVSFHGPMIVDAIFTLKFGRIKYVFVCNLGDQTHSQTFGIITLSDQLLRSFA